MFRTQDFRDANRNGTDDRDEGGTFVDTDKDGMDDNSQQADASQDFDNIQQGYENFQKNFGYQNSGNSFSDNFFQPVDKDNDRINDLQTGIYADQVGKNFDMARSEQQADFSSGLYKDNALFGANLELRNNRELTADQFKYTQRDKDKTFELTDEFQNREYGRNIGTMAATGEQTRKNYAAQGLQNRLGYITQGEQNRLQSAADGDQTRKNYRVEGDETRQTDSNRINTEGVNNRKGMRVFGDESRKTDTNRINTQGTQDRLTDTNRITTTGTENRLTDTNRINTQGTQNRLTDTNRITTQGSEDRKNYEFEDNINARGEARSSARAKGLARAF